VKVLVNLLWCRPGLVGGSEEYLVRQLLGLTEVAPDVELRVAAPDGFAAAHPELAERVGLVPPPVLVDRRLGRPGRFAAEALWLPGCAGDADVVHHGGGTIPPGRPSRPAVLTVHDLQYRDLPQYFSTVRRRYLERQMPRSVARADVVAVPSGFVAGTVVDAFGVEPGRIVVVPHGVEAPVAEHRADPAELRRRYGLGDRRVLVYPAITHPHKRHDFLVELLAGPWTDPDLVLVLLGGRGASDGALTEAVARAGVGHRVVRPGRVSDVDRDGLIALAEALVFPSEYEGFGAPVLEAMAAGTPVVCSDRAALPEVAGDAAIVRPLTIDAWADALDAVAADRDGLVARGLLRAARFTPAASGRALAEAYRRAGADSGSRNRADLHDFACGNLVPGGRRGLRVVVVCPHFRPDTAPTGTVMTRIVDELAARGHAVHVVTALPWYRDHAVDAGWRVPVGDREHTAWGSITRVNPFPGGDKRNVMRRALGFAAFSALAGGAGLAAGGTTARADAVIAMSPPLTLGVTGRLVAWWHRAPLVFNIQDVFPDAAAATGAISHRRVLAAASALERWSYRLADAITVLSDDLAANVRGKLPDSRAGTVHVIPNFVDAGRIHPADRMTAYRRELGIGDEPVVLYAGNIGFSQPLSLLLDAARRLPHVTFLINGEGSRLAELRADAAGLANVRFGGYLPEGRLVELLATGDIHVVALHRGLAHVSVPSKTYSTLAAGRPLVASIDAGTAVPALLAASGGGVAVAPDDADALTAAIAALVDDPAGAAEMGRRGREWVLAAASPGAVAEAYIALIDALAGR
jgi:colanic acid biosynthesis glycosyl transferase WcaI